MARDMADVLERFVTEFGVTPSDVAVFGSKKNIDKWHKVATRLETEGFTVVRQHHTEHLPWSELPDDIVRKEKSALIREQLALVARTRALLLCNYEKDGQKSHVGANALLQMTAAYLCEIPVFLFNGIPDTPNRDEVIALQPRVLEGRLDDLIDYLQEEGDK